jgi:hypothetical protein
MICYLTRTRLSITSRQLRHYSPLLPSSETYPCSAYSGGNLRSGVLLNNIRYRVGEDGDSVLNVTLPHMSSRENGAVMQRIIHDYPTQHQCLRASVRLKAPPRPSEPQLSIMGRRGSKTVTVIAHRYQTPRYSVLQDLAASEIGQSSSSRLMFAARFRQPRGADGAKQVAD